MRLCIVTCYDQPDYVRAVTLRSAAALLEDVDVVVVKNEHTGLLRYGEVLLKLLATRMKRKPDAYLLTFRGYEMLLPVRLVSMGKPLIYDEFINPIEWVVKEKRQVRAKPGSGRTYASVVRLVSRFIVGVVGSRLFAFSYRWLVGRVDIILTDTGSHADVSAKLTGVARDKYYPVPVGTDESVFRAAPNPASKQRFRVLYYGNMLPLHGLSYVIEAAVDLRESDVEFVLIGGNEQVASDVEAAVSKGATIDYLPWVDFEKLPGLMSGADLCLAGPFGNTFQSRYVITGKAYQFLAMGRPTVVGENLESGAFTDKVNALVAKQGSAQALAETIQWAMGNRKKLHRIGTEGQRLYAKRYSNDALAGYMRELLTRAGRPDQA